MAGNRHALGPRRRRGCSGWDRRPGPEPVVRYDLALADAPDDDRAPGAIQRPLAADHVRRQVVCFAREVEHDVDAGIPPRPAGFELQQADPLVMRVARAGVGNHLSPARGKLTRRSVDGEPAEPTLAGEGITARLLGNGGCEGGLVAAAERVEEADRDLDDPIEVAPGREGEAVRRGPKPGLWGTAG